MRTFSGGIRETNGKFYRSSRFRHADEVSLFQQAIAAAQGSELLPPLCWLWPCCAWLAGQLAWGEQRGTNQEHRWADGCFSSNLDFHNGTAVPRLIASKSHQTDAAMPLIRAPTKYWLHVFYFFPWRSIFLYILVSGLTYYHSDIQEFGI